MPFSTEQFYGIIESYNLAVGFGVYVLYALALGSILVVYSGKRNANRIAWSVLAFLWFWMGIVYHWAYFTRINPVALMFGALFVIQGMVFAVLAVRDVPLTFSRAPSAHGLFQSFCFIYSLFIYPVLGFIWGLGFPLDPIFGLPCPTTIFTFGFLSALSDSRVKTFSISAIPLTWAVIGTSAAFLFGVYQDLALAVTGIGLIALVWTGSRRRGSQLTWESGIETRFRTKNSRPAT